MFVTSVNDDSLKARTSKYTCEHTRKFKKEIVIANEDQQFEFISEVNDHTAVIVAVVAFPEYFYYKSIKERTQVILFVR